MNTRYILAGAIAAGCLFAASSAPARPLRVVTTIPDLASIAAAIGGDAVTVRSISEGHEDPHFLQARPAFVVHARNAELWIRTGLELEIGWEPVLLDSARNRSIMVGQPGFLDASQHIPVILEVPTGPVTRALGDVHPSGNPHYLLDPLNARAVARAIGARMAQLRPAEAGRFQAGTDAFVRELDARMFGEAAMAKADGETLWRKMADGSLDAWMEAEGIAPDGWLDRTAGLRGKRVVTFHKSFSYFAHRFGFKVAIELEPVPGVPPSPAHLARVIDLMNAEQIGLILMEPYYPRRPPEFVASRTGARVVVVSTLAPDVQPDAYFRMMDLIVRALVGTEADSEDSPHAGAQAARATPARNRNDE